MSAKIIPGEKYLLDNTTEVTIVRAHDRLQDRYVVESVAHIASDKLMRKASVELVHGERLRPIFNATIA